jgi:sec-independent protein translocase protein TatB
VFGIGGGEWLLVGLVALFVFGPEKLPGIARQAGAWLRDARRVVAAARRDLDRELGTDLLDDSLPFRPADLSRLDPGSAVRRHVLDGVLEPVDPPAPGAAPAAPVTRPRPAPGPARPGRTRFDAEAT